MRAEPVATGRRPHAPCACGSAGQGTALWSEAREVYKAVSAEETTVLAMPWAPRVDVLFVPRSLENVSGGLVRILARVPGAEVEIARAAFVPPGPLLLTAAAGCETYVVKASVTWTNPNETDPVDSYVYARVYHGR